MDLVTKAFMVARLNHKNQKTKVKKFPFFTHPLRVANILIQEGAKEELICAGLLHDTVEDTNLSITAIKKKFGINISSLVEFATEDMSKPWEVRKEEMIRACKSCSKEKLLLEFADKLANLEMLNDEFVEYGSKVFSKRGKKHIEDYYKRMFLIFKKRLPKLKNLHKYKLLFDNLFN